MISEAKLDFYIAKRKNVLLEGEHGVGKTSIVIAAFKRAGLRYVILSGATMDPFIDFVGVPVTVETQDGKKVIDLLRPKYLMDANPQAIFIDEFNRSHKKIRNAVMELTQFKTINGQKLGDDLRVVWAAVNPDNDDDENAGVYDTDRLDPAQRDRFHVQITIPYECDRNYFSNRYGSDIAKAAIEFWNALSDDVKKKVSPRRLDYALEMWKDGGDLRDVLPREANVSQLMDALRSGPSDQQLDPLIGNPVQAAAFLRDENNFNRVKQQLFTKAKYRSKLLPYAPPEKIATALAGDTRLRRRVLRTVVKAGKGHPLYRVLESIKNSGTNFTLTNAIQKAFSQIGIVQTNAHRAGRRAVI